MKINDPLDQMVCRHEIGNFKKCDGCFGPGKRKQCICGGVVHFEIDEIDDGQSIILEKLLLCDQCGHKWQEKPKI